MTLSFALDVQSLNPCFRSNFMATKIKLQVSRLHRWGFTHRPKLHPSRRLPSVWNSGFWYETSHVCTRMFTNFRCLQWRFPILFRLHKVPELWWTAAHAIVLIENEAVQSRLLPARKVFLKHVNAPPCTLPYGPWTSSKYIIRIVKDPKFASIVGRWSEENEDHKTVLPALQLMIHSNSNPLRR